MSEWLKFVVKAYTRTKTKVYLVISQCSGDTLGEIKWFNHWRYYCFFPTTKFETIHSDRCLLEISQFITKLNEEHKETLKKDISKHNMGKVSK